MNYLNTIQQLSNGLNKSKSKNEFIVAFVLHYPSVEVFDRIQSLLSEGYEVYVFDNSPKNTQPFILHYDLSSNNNFRYFSSGCNSGLSSSLSTLLSSAFYNGASNVLYFDQDTDFNSKTLSFISSFLVDNHLLFHDYSMVSLYGKNKYIESQNIIHEHTHIILSGSLFNLFALEEIGWFRGNYFVDGVDYKLCLDSINSGFKIGHFDSSPGFDHSSFQDNSIKIKIFNKSLHLKKYDYSRIKGIFISHVKLTIEALFTIQFLFAFRTIILLIGFLIKQFFIRIIYFVK